MRENRRIAALTCATSQTLDDALLLSTKSRFCVHNLQRLRFKHRR